MMEATHGARSRWALTDPTPKQLPAEATQQTIVMGLSPLQTAQSHGRD